MNYIRNSFQKPEFKDDLKPLNTGLYNCWIPGAELKGKVHTGYEERKVDYHSTADDRPKMKLKSQAVTKKNKQHGGDSEDMRRATKK